MSSEVNKTKTLAVALGLKGRMRGEGCVYVEGGSIFNSSILNDGYCRHRNQQEIFSVSKYVVDSFSGFSSCLYYYISVEHNVCECCQRICKLRKISSFGLF